MAGRGKGRKPAAPKVPKKKAGGYSMPPPIPLGEVIKDTLFKKEWRIGPSIGVGGFGEIYSAADISGSPKKKGTSYDYAIKVEPQENGPLFVEKNFYRKNANQSDITSFMKSKKLTALGMPTFFGTGNHEYKGISYRYLVIEKYGRDIWSIFKECGRKFPPATVFQLGLQMLDVLEYIHSRGYVHADIKGANMLLGIKRGTESQAYLVDFGLANRVKDQPFTPDKKCAHDGTIEYTSRDAHLGEATMRGDLEILAYNMLQWLVGQLPWETDTDLKKPPAVQAAKEAFMSDVRNNITTRYGDVPDALIKFFEYINKMKPKDIPDYNQCKKLFETFLKSEGKTRNSKLEFTPGKGKTKKIVDNNTVEDDSVDEADKETKVVAGDAPKKRGRKPKESADENKVPDHQKPKRKLKRKSTEPIVVTKVKRVKAKHIATPPAKENHANIATQTSIEKRLGLRSADTSRHVCFDSPISEVLGTSKQDSMNSSVDIFEDSMEKKEKKIKPKRKIVSDEEVVVTRVKRKVVSNAKSYKELPSIVNGRSPPM